MRVPRDFQHDETTQELQGALAEALELAGSLLVDGEELEIRVSGDRSDGLSFRVGGRAFRLCLEERL